MAITLREQRRAEKYDRVSICVQKGRRAEYQRAAKDFGMTFRELVQRSIEDFITNYKGEDFFLRNKERENKQ